MMRARSGQQGTACAFVLDIAGTERLFGPPAQLAERLREELAAAGFRASIAVSANFDTARMKAASMRGIAVIPEGAEAEALARLPIAALDLDEEYAATFALWGIGTLGELAALPEADLVARMGPKARAWRALARGEAEHAFEPIEAEFALEEFCEFETPVEQIDSLLFVGARMIDCLATRAAGRALALRSLTAEMGLEGGGTHGCAIRPAVPTIDRKFLLKLLQLEIGAHPPQAAVVRLTLRAEAGAQSKVQLGLFAPQTPEPSRLDVTLARLRAMVGEERVGSPVLEDTHRADGFRMEGFVNPGPQMRGTGGTHRRSCKTLVPIATQAELGWGTPRMALRRVRPARAVRVVLSPTLAAKGARKCIRAQRTGTWGTRAGCVQRWREPVRDCGGVWAVEDERLLVGTGRVGRGGVGCAGGNERRPIRCVPADARSRRRMRGGWRRFTTDLSSDIPNTHSVPNAHSPGTPVCHPNDAYRPRGFKRATNRQRPTADPSTRSAEADLAQD